MSFFKGYNKNASIIFDLFEMLLFYLFIWALKLLLKEKFHVIFHLENYIEYIDLNMFSKFLESKISLNLLTQNICYFLIKSYINKNTH